MTVEEVEMLAEGADEKITYTTMSVEQAVTFNRAYDAALADVLGRLGKHYPVYIDGQPITGRATFDDSSPNDTSMVIGSFQDCGAEEVRLATAAAGRAYLNWSHVPWRDRLTIMRRAADNFRARKYEIAAWLTLEAGKPRLEAMGEVEEAADLITTYSAYMEENSGFERALDQLSPQESNRSVLRPYGVWAVVAPFNFPVALATGMVAAALIAGNTVVFKPSQDTPLCGLLVYECLAAAGLPEGSVNVLTGRGDDTGKFLVADERVDAVAFIGSVPVGNAIYHQFTAKRPRPVVAEMGGKNPVIVTARADLDKAVEGTVRAAFGFSGQKCSAASRVYVHDEVADEFIRRLAVRTNELVVGNPSDAEVFAGPVIDERAFDRFKEACAVGRKDGEIISGGETLATGDLARGFYCGLTNCVLPADHHYFYQELFVPFLAVARVASLDEALQRANDSEFGLTAGIFSEDDGEIATFLDRIQAGVVYVNRKAGATTGAWPGVQSFGGWKASGSTGKSALGPYYVQQFMREQTQAIVTD